MRPLVWLVSPPDLPAGTPSKPRHTRLQVQTEYRFAGWFGCTKPYTQTGRHFSSPSLAIVPGLVVRKLSELERTVNIDRSPGVKEWPTRTVLETTGHGTLFGHGEVIEQDLFGREGLLG